ncbi:MAG: hypothetical protein QOJ26_959 [Thermoplasmata archaeon]|nr:hypothetical protein [Thermoplasmata archaeon]
MADKIGPGTWHDGPPPDGDPPAWDGRDRGEEARLTTKRDNARWTGVVGFAMLFGGAIHYGIVLGGLFMAGYGAVASIYWSRRLRKVKGDPWAYDPELDGPEAADWRRR